MRIYTRGGDKGRTSLFSGQRVDKHSLRVEALGEVDELVAVLGLAKAALEGAQDREWITAVQTSLYQLLSDLATVDQASAYLPADAATGLEILIDGCEAQLPPLRDFLIPGDSPASAALHHARTVCRRAERRVAALAAAEPLSAVIPAYLNRLADLLFVLARWADRGGTAPEAIFKDRS
jgi:cob(I)alamin adenosyltransferase